ncbi:MAG: cbb3-type cytochrome c oxidase subunit I [Candidatus Wallbacteria bacterium]|nr:cbb3-type cytochrome c oxidase subunit I [Candidatus Wallbacteria bacterium]
MGISMLYSPSFIFTIMVMTGVFAFAALVAWIGLSKPESARVMIAPKIIDDAAVLQRRRKRWPYYLIDPLARAHEIKDRQNPVWVKEQRVGFLAKTPVLIRLTYVGMFISLMLTIYTNLEGTFKAISEVAQWATTFIMLLVPILAATGIFIAGFSSILTGLNFIVTIHTMRAPGLTWFRLPLFVWAHYATAFIQVLGTPVVASVIALVGIERLFHVGIFDPALGGDPLLFQHLFWFYSHPAVYIMILPAMGVISELVTCFSRKRIFGYDFVAYSSIAIAALGLLVWGHHMFVSGQSMYASFVFSFLSFLVAIPSAVKTFNWTATLHKGSIRFSTPMIYTLGFLGLFAIGGLTGLFLACLGVDIHVHDTYFVVAHFHYIMVGGAVMAYLGGIHFWWPKMTGRLYPEFWGRLSAMVIFIGFNLTFFPQFLLGYMGMPRRYYAYPAEFQVLNVMSTAGASILGFGYLMPLLYLLWSLKWGQPAGNNPWGAKGLEWETPSPPIVQNFETTPVVTQEAYAYSAEEAEASGT